MSNQTFQTKAAQLYAEAGLIYIRAPSKVETRANGQKNDQSEPLPKPRPDQGTTNLQRKKRRRSCSINGSGVPPGVLRSPT